jgi:signal transduction histidine kinase
MDQTSSYLVNPAPHMENKLALHPVLTGNVIEVIEREQRLLAQELHDGLNQEFAVLAIEMKQLERQLNPSEADQVRSFRKQLDALIHVTRSIARRLHPSIVDDLGLAAALDALCRAFSVSPTVVTFATETQASDLAANTAVCLYRVAQESVRNAIKHSGCDHIQVRLSEVRRHVVLTIQDLGRGFDVRDHANKKGLGLAIMAERVRLTGGEFSIRSALGRGTLIRATVPLAGNCSLAMNAVDG